MIYQEDQYLELLQKINYKIEQEGFATDDRTGVGTCKIFGAQMRFDLSESFPLFTHKQVFMRGIFEELMWFLRGDTNIKTLLEKNVHIWTEWRYKAYKAHAIKENGEGATLWTQDEFEKRILNNREFAAKFGDIGKGYGHQWRRFGELKVERDDTKTLQYEYLQDGFDQIKWVINEIKTNPNSRRLIVSGWNPHDVGEVDLPPCHTLFQFFVEKGKLSCQLYQRSGDILLGVPSYALLTHLVALECGLEVGEFIWTGGDIHVYSNQYDGLKEIILNRQAMNPPTIKINKKEDIFSYEWEDIEIVNYNNMGRISIPVAV